MGELPLPTTLTKERERGSERGSESEREGERARGSERGREGAREGAREKERGREREGGVEQRESESRPINPMPPLCCELYATRFALVRIVHGASVLPN